MMYVPWGKAVIREVSHTNCAYRDRVLAEETSEAASPVLDRERLSVCNIRAGAVAVVLPVVLYGTEKYNNINLRLETSLSAKI